MLTSDGKFFKILKIFNPWKELKFNLKIFEGIHPFLPQSPPFLLSQLVECKIANYVAWDIEHVNNFP